MNVRSRPAFWVAAAWFCVVLLSLGQHDVKGAKLAATLAAREKAQKAREEEKGVDPEETQKQKSDFEQLQKNIRELLRNTKEFKQRERKKQQEEELAEFDPGELEKEELWRKEYEQFVKAQKHKNHWERLGIVTGIASLFSTGIAAFAKSEEHKGAVDPNPAAVTLMKGSGTAALLTGAGAMVSWLMRRHNKKRQKLHNARLLRMQFEARTGLKPGEENVLGPDESEILAQKKKEDKEKRDR